MISIQTFPAFSIKGLDAKIARAVLAIAFLIYSGWLSVHTILLS